MRNDSDPALQPPDNVQPNFANPQTLMPAVIATSTVVLVLAFSFVFARAFVKVYIWRGHHVEDWLSYIALVGLAANTGVLIYLEDYGLARHQWDVTMAQYRHIMYYISIIYCLYGPTTMAAKLSVFFQMKRIFTTGARDLVYWVIIASIAANVVFYTAIFFSYLFQCWPRARIWDPDVPGYCISSGPSNLAAGVLNLVFDIEALLLPAWAVWHLKMPVKRKLAVYSVFGVGLIACIIGSLGIYLRVQVLLLPDFTWLGSQTLLLVNSEIAMVIVVGCMPSLPRLYHYIFNTSRSSRRDNDDSGFRKKGNDTPPAQGNHYSRRTSSKRRNIISGSLAKYLTPGVTAGITTLASRASDEEWFELRAFSGQRDQGDSRAGNSNDWSGIWMTTKVEQQSVRQSSTPPP
ncbi:hypothetical protein GGR54DRAFT_592541 [Hypoxylon sp. NC1633]|nr:hypothetical protein GGR54DRAFT_592541 [Hypoxylon sp. NC1633]